MREREAISANGTIAWIFPTASDAEKASARLRAAGFPDARLSEGAGTTAEAHVPAADGLTESDFASSLESAGFMGADASELTNAVVRGGTLLTLAAGAGVERALAVLRGEAVAAEALTPVDAPSILHDPVLPEHTGTPESAESALRTLELREEQLNLSTRREFSEARIRKETVTEQRTVTVPVRSERLVVERDGQEPILIPISDERTDA